MLDRHGNLGSHGEEEILVLRIEDFFGLPLLQETEKGQGTDGSGLGDQGHAEKRQDLLRESLQRESGFSHFRDEEGPTGKGYGPGRPFPQNDGFEGVRRFFEPNEETA